MTRRNLIFYSARTQYENLGDLVINRILLKELRKYGDLIIEDQEVPEWFCKELEISAQERASNYKFKFSILMVYLGLKGLLNREINTYFVTTPGHFYDSHHKTTMGAAFKKISYLLILYLLRVRICRFGASIGPFSYLGKVVERWQSKLMYFYSTRDSLSEKYAHDIGIQKVEQFPDLAWFIERHESIGNSLKFDADYVVFSFRDASSNINDSNKCKDNFYSILDAVVDLVCKKWNKKMVISYQVDFDYDFCKELQKKYAALPEVTLLEDKVDNESMYGLYSQALFVFSNRLHVLMFAMASGTIAIPILNTFKHSKISGIFLDAGLGELIIDTYKSASEVETLEEINRSANLWNSKIFSCFEEKERNGKQILKRVMTNN